MLDRSKYPIKVALALVIANSANAATPEWRVVLTPSSSIIQLPGLPAPGSYSLALPGAVLSDSAGASLNFPVRLSSTNAIDLWHERAGLLQPYAQIAQSGVTGPGRTGAESNDVFRRFTNLSNTFVRSDTSAQDARAFTAQASALGAPAEQISIGAWAQTTSGNVEIARVGTDGVLGPGIGAGWTFGSDDSENIFGKLHALPDGAVLIQAVAKAPTAPNLPLDLLARYQPSLGNSPCALADSLNPAWAPGVLANDSFFSILTAASSPRGEVFAAAGAVRRNPNLVTRRGIWQFCAGAPQAKALSDTTGALGPNIPGNSAATFTDLLPLVAPSTAGAFYFSGIGVGFKGVFHHSNGQNRALLLNGVEGALGPGIPGYVFDFVNDYEPIAAGKFAVLRATIRPFAGGNSISALWRLRPDASPEPLIIVDSTTYIPAPGRLWRDVGIYNIFENGDVITQAVTSNPPALDSVSLWRLRPGHAPEEILKKGDLVRTPTATGTDMRAVRSISRPDAGSAALRAYGGDDSWVSASGAVLVKVEIEPMEGQIYLVPWVRAQVTNLDALFQDGFE